MNNYTQNDLEIMLELKDELIEIAAKIEAITQGDAYAEAYFTNHLSNLINKSNPYDTDINDLIEGIQESLYGEDDEAEKEYIAFVDRYETARAEMF